jgi:hypothetical protein
MEATVMRDGASILVLAVCLGAVANAEERSRYLPPAPPAGSFAILDARDIRAPGLPSEWRIDAPVEPIAVFHVAYAGPREIVELALENFVGRELVSRHVLVRAPFAAYVMPEEDVRERDAASTGQRLTFALWVEEMLETLPDGRNALARVAIGDAENPEFGGHYPLLVNLKAYERTPLDDYQRVERSPLANRGLFAGVTPVDDADFATIYEWISGSALDRRDGHEIGRPTHPRDGIVLSRLVLRFVRERPLEVLEVGRSIVPDSEAAQESLHAVIDGAAVVIGSTVAMDDGSDWFVGHSPDLANSYLGTTSPSGERRILRRFHAPTVSLVQVLRRGERIHVAGTIAGRSAALGPDGVVVGRDAVDRDGFIAEVRPDGRFTSTRRFGGNGEETVASAIFHDGRLVVCGSTASSTQTFGNAIDRLHWTYGRSDGYVVSIDPHDFATSVTRYGGEFDDHAFDLAELHGDLVLGFVTRATGDAAWRRSAGAGVGERFLLLRIDAHEGTVLAASRPVELFHLENDVTPEFLNDGGDELRVRVSCPVDERHAAERRILVFD